MHVMENGYQKEFKGADAALLVVMQKVLDIPFVPPLDVPTGTQTNIASLKTRYWTVFDPGALERLTNRKHCQA